MSTTQETKNQDEKDERSFCNNCRKVTSWRKARKRSRCLSCNTIFPCAHACEHWDCREERGEAKPDANGVLRLVTPTLLILALSLASLATSACGGSAADDNPSDALPALPASSDAAPPFSMPRTQGPPSPQTPGADAGAVDGVVTGGTVADARSGDMGAPPSDVGDGGNGAKDGGAPPILQPKPDAGGSCQPGSACPLAVDEGSGIYSLKSGTTKPPSSCILGTGSLSAVGVYWFQDYQGKRYAFRIVGSCAVGATQPHTIFPYVKIEDVNPECGTLTDQLQLSGEWKSFVGPHTFVETGALDGVSCMNKRGRCARYQCYDSSGKVVK